MRAPTYRSLIVVQSKDVDIKAHRDMDDMDNRAPIRDKGVKAPIRGRDVKAAIRDGDIKAAIGAADILGTIRRAGVGRCLAAVAAAGFACLSYMYLTLPDVRPLRTSNPATTAFIELRAREARANGKTPRRIQRWVSYKNMSRDLTRAVLVAEDAAFWQHEGLDVEQLQESFEADWASGSFARGGSTITQQLAKNLYLSPSKNPLRKLKELIIARRLEAELTKSRILELYLNVIEWGDGIYGADAAARTYFQSGAGTLKPSEAAILAGAIVNPRVLNPGRPNTRLLRRQGIIMQRMGSVTPPPPPVESVAVPPPAPVALPVDEEPSGQPPLTSPAPPDEPTAEPESPDLQGAPAPVPDRN
jgi:monofunctional glycosyltransferase